MAQKKGENQFMFKPKEVPTNPGCYLFYGEKEDDLLYVGKAKNLRKRVSSYFQKDHDVSRLQVLVSKIRRIETRVVNSEMEALVLENNLIKQYMPRYNVKLRDDKNFVYLRITNEETPKMEIVRRLVKDGSNYIGPRTSTKNFKNLIRFCQKYFRIQMVKESQNYYPHLQAGLLEEDPDVYKKRVGIMRQFLNGKTSSVLKELQEKMMQFAKDKNFEAAAKTRDLMQSIDIATENQTVVEFSDQMNRDCIQFVRQGEWAYFVRIAFRYGKMLHQNEIEVKAPSNLSDAEVLRDFLLQFYPKVVDLASEILIPLELDEGEAVGQYLSDTCFEGKKVLFVVPQKGDKKKVLEVAQKNAEFFAKRQQVEALNSTDNFSKALPELAEVLDFETPPKRIECYDISHFSGQDTVASMVVFTDGKPDKGQYRRFKIQTLEEGKIDDFASMKEVLHRRFARAIREQESETKPELTMRLVETDEEWETYHAIRKKEIFERYRPDIEYDDDHPDEKKKNNAPIVFLKNGKIIGTVRLDKKGKTQVVLRLFAIQEPFQRQGWGTKALEIIEDWALEQGAKKVLLNSNKEAVSFYGKSGYIPGVWKGDSTDETCVPLGKKLEGKEKWPLPDLIVIDGGKGQLSAVMDVFQAEKYKNIETEKGKVFDPDTQIISLAKKEELIFRPGVSDPIELPYESASLQLLQRLRDEAHRFAITHNRALRKKSAHKSVLDEIEGIGGTTKKKLLQTFGSVKEIREASDEDLLKVLNKKQLGNLRRGI